VSLIPTFKGLGISLTPNGIISAIEPNSPSDRAGLRKDNRIVEVNRIDVRDRSNKDIAKIIKEYESNLEIGVLKTNLDQEQYQTSPLKSSSHGNLKNIMNDIVTMPAPPTSPPSYPSQPSTSYRPSTDGTSNLKSIVSEMHQYPGQSLPPPTNESMPNIKAMVADVIRMQAPSTTAIGSGSGQKISGLIQTLF